VVRRVVLDPVLYGHNMAVDGCTAYVALQNGMRPSKLAVVDLCGKDSAGVPQPVVVSETAGSYAAMNGMTVAGDKLYVTYGWATNPLEIRETKDAGKVVGCVALFSDEGYATCGQSARGNGALWGGAPVVMGRYAYVPENSDDAGEAVQVVDVSDTARPVKVAGVRGAPAGVTAGRSVQGGVLAGIWAPAGGASTSGPRLYVGTITVPQSEGQPVTIAAYDAGRDAERPVRVGQTVSLEAGYIIENMAVEGTTVVANLWNEREGRAAIAVVDFANEQAPRVTTIEPTKGCVPGAGNFIEMKKGLALFGCSTLGPSLNGIEVVDVRDAGRPLLLGLVATELKRVNFLSLQGRWLFAVDVEGKMDVVDMGK
jgi:hypothetical protein